MVTLDWDVERSDGVTLVALFVASDRPCRVRIENRLDGPVWPPRRRGQPAAGWEDGEFTGRVPPDGRLTVGYATPAPPADPPAAVVSTEPVDPGTGQPGEPGAEDVTDVAPAVEPTPAGVVRTLGDPLVPRDCVPIPGGRAGADAGTGDAAAPAPAAPAGSAANAGTSGAPAAAPGGTAAAPATVTAATDAGSGGERTGNWPGEDGGDAGDRGGDRRGVVGRNDGCRGSRGSDSGTQRSDGPVAGHAATGDRLVIPGPVRTWLRDVDRRLDAERGRRSDEDGGQRPAAAASTESPLGAAVAADRRALERVRWRVGVLVERARRLDRPRDGRDDGRR